MGGLEITAAAVVAVVLAILGWVWRLAYKLATQDGRIQAAEIMAANSSAKASTLERDLAEHREHVASEYVSRGALKEITDAINRLGDRLDGLFYHLTPKP